MSAHNAAGLAPPARTHDEASALLRRPFAPGAIGFRAMSKVPWNGDPWGGAQVAAYIGAQSVLQRLNCVVPGLIHTPLVDRLADLYADGDREGYAAHRHAQVPMRRMGDAWDVAHAALFLASDEARYITATELVVDGGLVATTP